MKTQKNCPGVLLYLAPTTEKEIASIAHATLVYGTLLPFQNGNNFCSHFGRVFIMQHIKEGLSKESTMPQWIIEQLENNNEFFRKALASIPEKKVSSGAGLTPLKMALRTTASVETMLEYGEHLLFYPRSYYDERQTKPASGAIYSTTSTDSNNVTWKLEMYPTSSSPSCFTCLVEATAKKLILQFGYEINVGVTPPSAKLLEDTPEFAQDWLRQLFESPQRTFLYYYPLAEFFKIHFPQEEVQKYL
jgi:hypothetical protein